MEYISGLGSLQNCLNCEQYILLFFTASWCGPCKKIYPELEELYKNLNKDLIKIYKLDVDDEENNLVIENKEEVIRNLDKAYSNGIISKNFRDRNKSRISKLQ